MVLLGTYFIAQVILESPELKMYSQLEHKTTPKYANGNVCIMGDAAHATTPWQGSGAAMAIEDSAVLGALLGNVKSSEEIPLAFQVYDQVRRSRCQRIIDSSKITGKLMCCQGPAASADADTMRGLMGERWDFIKDFDTSVEMGRAVAELNKLNSHK